MVTSWIPAISSNLLYFVNQMGHKQISYISNGRVHKSDEIAEEEKYLRGRID